MVANRDQRRIWKGNGEFREIVEMRGMVTSDCRRTKKNKKKGCRAVEEKLSWGGGVCWDGRWWGGLGYAGGGGGGGGSVEGKALQAGVDGR